MGKNPKEVTPQIKSRTTKLSKKTNNELIEIILRKDKTESNLSSQVKNLKAENNTLTNSIAEAGKSLKEAKDKLNQFSDMIDAKSEIIASKTEELNNIRQQYSVVCSNNVEVNKKLKSYKHLCYVLLGFVVLLGLSFLL